MNTHRTTRQKGPTPPAQPTRGQVHARRAAICFGLQAAAEDKFTNVVDELQLQQQREEPLTEREIAALKRTEWVLTSGSLSI